MREATGLIWCLFPDRDTARAHAAMPGIEADLVTFRDTSEGVQVGYGQRALGHVPGMAVRAQNLGKYHSDLHLLCPEGDQYYLLAIRHGIIDPRTDCHGSWEKLSNLSRLLDEEGYGKAQQSWPGHQHHHRLRPVSITSLGGYSRRWVGLPALTAGLLLVVLPFFEGPDAPAKAVVAVGPRHLNAWDAYHHCRDAGRLLHSPSRWECDFGRGMARGPDGMAIKLVRMQPLQAYDHGINPPVIPGRGLSWEGSVLQANLGFDGAVFLTRHRVKVTRITMEAQYPMGISARFFVQ